MTHLRTSAIKITKPRTKPRTPFPAPAGRDAAKPAEPGPASEKPSLQPPPDKPAGDSRLPALGARLVRTAGKKRCECVVEEKGFRYGGRLYPSLSAAAAAAASNLGLNPSQNGFLFWGVSSAARSPLEVLAHRFRRYSEALERSLTTRAAEGVRREALQHFATLKRLLRGSSEAVPHRGRAARTRR